jgi:hypothetical protein
MTCPPRPPGSAACWTADQISPAAEDPVDLFPAPDHDQQRDRLRAEPRGESRIRVHIDLYDLQVPRVTLARSSSTGEIIRHGPHHAAQKSTTTGTHAAVSAVNVPVSASTTHGSADLHRGHRGAPCAIGPTRLRASHVGQPIIVMITRVERGARGRLTQPIGRLEGVADVPQPRREGRSSDGQSRPPERRARRPLRTRPRRQARPPWFRWPSYSSWRRHHREETRPFSSVRGRGV